VIGRAAFNLFLAMVLGCRCALPSQSAFATPPSDGLILWLDADDIDADADPSNNPRHGTPVTRWADKSDRGNHVEQDSPEWQPTFHTKGLGERPTIRFHGDDLLDRPRFKGLSTGDQLFHVLIVMKAPAKSSHAAQRLIDLNSRDEGSNESPKRAGFWVGFQQGRGKVRLGIHSGDEGEGQSIAWNDKANLVETVYSGEQSFTIHVNGKRDQRAVFNGTHFLGFRKQVTLAIGQHFAAESNQATFYQGDIAEVLVYNRPLTATERYETGKYLADKYSLKTEFRPIPQFEKDVRPILARRCHGCHGEETREAELDLRTVSAMLRGGKAGPIIVRGFPDRSEMISRIEADEMPPEGEDRLTSDEKRIIHDWVEADAPSNEATVVAIADSKITEKDRQHWAYQKLVDREAPNVKQLDRVGNAVDRFVLKKLEEKELTFSTEADRVTLIRRAYFDLIGLPPSPMDIDAFVNDDKPKAYERLIDRLLASKHYGERWGRYWLDVSGSVDLHGSDNDFNIIKPLEGKWRFRDYVIRSFNQDKPFDKFLIEQLAGDELHDWRNAEKFTPEIVESLVATNFLLCANDDTSQNELNTPDIRHHVLQRTTEVVAANLLALTVMCSKCHDHKYEAISQNDYYRLESIFAPAFNVRHWVTATNKGRADISDKQKAEIDRLNGEIDAKVKSLKSRESEIRGGYGAKLFDEKLASVPESDRALAKTAVQTPADKRNDDQKQLVSKYGAALTVKPEEINAALSEQHKADLADITKQIGELNMKRQAYGTIQVVWEPTTPPPTYVLRRGNYLRPGLEVEPALLSILREPHHRTKTVERPAGQSSGRRLAFAKQLTDSNSLAGQYVARVFVNRIWQQVFGRGIVATSDNFGVSGSRPTHPELLDWLTFEFINNGWRVKSIVKNMMMSHAYRQESTQRPNSSRAAQIDPENNLLWRMNLRRVESEYIRDAMLTASGKLDRSMFGLPLPLNARPDGMVVINETALPTPTSKWRRSIYVLARRNYHLTILRIFDQPIVARNCTVRKPSTVVTQSLTLLHDDFVLEQAGYFAERVAGSSAGDNPKDQVATAFRIAIGRQPTDEETRWCSGLIERQRKRYTKDGSTKAEARHRALAQLCKVLFNTNEFLYVQ